MKKEILTDSNFDIRKAVHWKRSHILNTFNGKHVNTGFFPNLSEAFDTVKYVCDLLLEKTEDIMA